MLVVIDYSAHRVDEKYSLTDWLNLNKISYYRMCPGSKLPDRVSAIIVTGGPFESKQCGDTMRIVQQYRVPILGICLGCMCIVAAFGGVLEMCEQSENIEISAHDMLGFSGTSKATSAYRERIAMLPDILMPRAFDGSEIVGVQHRELPVYGLMFHPESPLTDCGSEMLLNFLRT